MTSFESSIKEIPYSQKAVYSKLSDLNNLEAVKDKLPSDKLSDLAFDADTLSFSVPPVGTICLKIVEREPDKCIKFGSEASPLPFNLWIQLVPVTETTCKMKITLKAELNLFIKKMVENQLREGLEKMAAVLASLPYE